MQCKFADGSVMVAGRVTKDADMRHIGDKGTPKLSFGVFAGKRKDTTNIFVDCAAFSTLALDLNGLKKGDSFAGIGQIKEREYNGKTYKTLELEWGNSPALNAKPANTLPPPQYGTGKPMSTPTAPDVPETDAGFAEVANAGDELPF